MAEAAATPETKAPEAPKQTCEKCRQDYTADHFAHGIQAQACVCRRCLVVMGYRIP